ncbi:MAG TPA: multicopper oxidase domain-containing protein, partial [Desulfurivibrionaceae bacterium]|nr:multicopper oxidase domain-containing protein [Desulfurivibrionaceae bacterium]
SREETGAVLRPPAAINGSPGGREYGARFGLLAADAASRGEPAPEGGKARPLTPYATLRSPTATTLPAGKEIREIRLTLDGDMQRYVWMLNNRILSETDHLLVREGEVVRLIMINRTMMHHPMHLHGHFFRVLNGQGEHAPRKHTVDVAPMSTTVIEFYTDEPGDWFFHCHLLYHMKSGMARLVHYQDFQPGPEVLAIRSRLYEEHWYSQAEGEVLSNMSEGMLALAKTRIMLKATWEIGWGEVDAEEWEGIATAGWYRNRFTTFFLGGRSEGVRSQESATVGILGLNYLLPLNVSATGWLDSEGDSRIRLAKEFELAPRLALHAETQYDSREKWEGSAGLTYLLTRHLGLAGKWHSEYGFGAGLQGGF